ncbi:MAG: hypothetical protein K8L99_07985 [Anaerolineae bacterium]|nr:hypothetical protein [Anaerolineae bacterium]
MAKCVCGCGRKLRPGKTGKNFATPACVLRVMQSAPELLKALGEENYRIAIEALEKRDSKP